MQTRLYNICNKKEIVKALELEPVLIKKNNYLSLFPEQTKTICATLNNGDPKNQIRKQNGVLVGPSRKMDNCEVVKTNDFKFDYNRPCDNDLLIKFNKKIESFKPDFNCDMNTIQTINKQKNFSIENVEIIANRNANKNLHVRQKLKSGGNQFDYNKIQATKPKKK